MSTAACLYESFYFYSKKKKKTVEFAFTLYIWGTQSLFLGQSSNLKNEVLVEWALNQIKYWLAAPQFWVAIVLAHISCRQEGL